MMLYIPENMLIYMPKDSLWLHNNRRGIFLQENPRFLCVR